MIQFLQMSLSIWSMTKVCETTVRNPAEGDHSYQFSSDGTYFAVAVRTDSTDCIQLLETDTWCVVQVWHIFWPIYIFYIQSFTFFTFIFYIYFLHSIYIFHIQSFTFFTFIFYIQFTYFTFNFWKPTLGVSCRYLFTNYLGSPCELGTKRVKSKL